MTTDALVWAKPDGVTPSAVIPDGLDGIITEILPRILNLDLSPPFHLDKAEPSQESLRTLTRQPRQYPDAGPGVGLLSLPGTDTRGQKTGGLCEYRVR